MTLAAAAAAALLAGQRGPQPSTLPRGRPPAHPSRRPTHGAARAALALAVTAVVSAAAPTGRGSTPQPLPGAPTVAGQAAYDRISTFDLARSYPNLQRLRGGFYLSGTNRYGLATSASGPDHQTNLWFEPLADGEFKQFATSPFRDCHWDLLRWEPGASGLLRYLATYAGCYSDHTEIVFRPGIAYMPRSWTRGQRWTTAGTSATVYDDDGVPVCEGTNRWRSTVIGLTRLPDGMQAVHTQTEEVQTLVPVSATVNSAACPRGAVTSFGWQENFYLASLLHVRGAQGSGEGVDAGLARSTGGNTETLRTAGHPDWDSIFAGWKPLPPAGEGTLVATAATVPSGSTGNTVTFVYTAPARPLADAALTITVPPGWSPPVALDQQGCTTSTAGSVSTTGQTITVSDLALTAGAQVRVIYGATAAGPCGAGDGATAPSVAGAPVWQGVLMAADSAPASLPASPTIDVDAVDGSGTLMAAPATAAAGSTGNALVFTYTAALGGLSDGTLTLAVPPGWTPPVTTNGPGCTASSAGTLSTDGQTIVVSGLTLAANRSVVISYGAQSGGDCSAGDGATAPNLPGAGAFAGSEASSATGTLIPLPDPPTIEVG